MYEHLVDLLLKAARCETYNTEYDFIVQFYGTDLDKFNLKIQLDQVIPDTSPMEIM